MQQEKNLLEPYEGYKATQLEVIQIHKKKVRNTMFIIAALLLGGQLMGMLMADVSIAQPLTIISLLVFPVIYAGIGLLAMKDPMIAAIAGAAAFLLILASQFAAAGWPGVISGLIMKAIFVGLILFAFQNAKQARETKKEVDMM